MTYPAADPFDDFYRRRRKRLPRWVGPAVLAAIVAVVALVVVLRGPTTEVHEGERKIINVVLPPPPPPPPPPPQEPKPPEPQPEPIPQPANAPPPPQPPQPQAQSTDALTARSGAGPSNYGLQQGNGAGTRIGGASGDNGFGAFGNLAISEIRRSAQSDPALAAGNYTVQIQVQLDPSGRVTGVRFLKGSGDAKRDAALERRLSGLQLSKRPPDGLSALRVEINAGDGA